MPNPEHVLADCVEHMASMEPDSVDAIVCDPPYGIRFMGKAWDGAEIEEAARKREAMGPSASRLASGRTTSGFTRSDYAGAYDRSTKGNLAFQEWSYNWATQALRVLKPGGHLVAFGSTRTHHRLMVALEDAGFEIRDTLCWLYGSGFPKSASVSKAIDKAAGAEREVVGRQQNWGRTRLEDGKVAYGDYAGEFSQTTPATEAAQQWDGWGTALKPSWEIIALCRKPLSERTVAANVLRWGVGGINIDSNRIKTHNSTYEEENRSGGQGLSRKAEARASARHELRGLRQADEAVDKSNQPRKITNDLQSTMPVESDDGSEQPQVEGWSVGLQAGGVSRPTGRHSAGYRQGVAARPERSPGEGTPPGNGESIRETTTEYRDGAPHQRGQEGQPDRKSSPIGVDRTRQGAFANNEAAGRGGGGKRQTESVAGDIGRWPANLVLAHSPECVEVGTKQVKSSTLLTTHHLAESENTSMSGKNYERNPRQNYAPDGTETVAAWECAPDCAVRLLDEQSGERGGSAPGFTRENHNSPVYSGPASSKDRMTVGYLDSGGASRFFYTAKVSPSERQQENGRSMHPTQKPVDLMRWLCRLVCPPNGLILDPFMGSGTTGIAALAEGFSFIGIEKEQEYYDMAVGREAQVGMGL
ncbi:hypothetical protein LCGC14_0313050 [marine sediment metagenome]|uniref:DNA methylase N-4/N-6 domain-containing protein n=1 Tax=marine sediment metagenome TaxID=412755 RepID=A0A0F9WT82_9ZZZZ